MERVGGFTMECFSLHRSWMTQKRGNKSLLYIEVQASHSQTCDWNTRVHQRIFTRITLSINLIIEFFSHSTSSHFIFLRAWIWTFVIHEFWHWNLDWPAGDLFNVQFKFSNVFFHSNKSNGVQYWWPWDKAKRWNKRIIVRSGCSN